MRRFLTGLTPQPLSMMVVMVLKGELLAAQTMVSIMSVEVAAAMNS